MEGQVHNPTTNPILGIDHEILIISSLLLHAIVSVTRTIVDSKSVVDSLSETISWGDPSDAKRAGRHTTLTLLNFHICTPLQQPPP